ncbi:MAG: hypothetical protein ABJA37_00505 [Ferruginibacter sp.]
MPKASPKKYTIGALVYVLLFASAAEKIGGGDNDTKCGGEEHWEQKVLIDPAADSINFNIKAATIKQLLAIDTKLPVNKYKESKPRMEIEKQIYEIKHCFVTDILRENDNDLHLVIEDGAGNHMIAEVPDASCPAAQASDWSGNFEEVRADILTYANNYRHYLFTITGVLFVDKSHGQTGVAPNSIELHPIIAFTKEKKINPIPK